MEFQCIAHIEIYISIKKNNTNQDKQYINKNPMPIFLVAFF